MIFQSRKRIRAGKGVSPFPPGGGALMETGKVVQERHTAPVGAKPAFLRALGTPCACCRRRSRAEPPDADQIIDRYPDGG